MMLTYFNNNWGLVEWKMSVYVDGRVDFPFTNEQYEAINERNIYFDIYVGF